MDLVNVVKAYHGIISFSIVAEPSQYGLTERDGEHPDMANLQSEVVEALCLASKALMNMDGYKDQRSRALHVSQLSLHYEGFIYWYFRQLRILIKQFKYVCLIEKHIGDGFSTRGLLIR